MKIRAVIDSNIIVKSLISKRNVTAAKKILAALDQNLFESITSDELLTEQRVVLKQMIPKKIAEVAVLNFELKSTKVELESNPKLHESYINDITDIQVIQTAIDGNADYIITDNISDFSKSFIRADGNEGATIKPRIFLNILGIHK